MFHHGYIKKKLLNLKLWPLSFAVLWAARMDYFSFWSPKQGLIAASLVNSAAKLFGMFFVSKYPHYHELFKSHLASTVSEYGKNNWIKDDISNKIFADYLPVISVRFFLSSKFRRCSMEWLFPNRTNAMVKPTRRPIMALKMM